jgi:D-sedoheptulose 7-phosphate isomerase
MQETILSAVNQAVEAITFLKKPQSLAFIEAVVAMICQSFSKGGKILIAGNGGSLCDAMHFGEEITGIFRAKRKALPAICLADPGHLTCIANDLGFDHVFSRHVEALGRAGDILIVLTTSGNSQNLIEAVKAAKMREMQTIAFLGRGGGKLKAICDLEWSVDGFPYSDRVQEAHMTALHIIVEFIEKELFSLAKAADETAFLPS